MRLFGWIEGKKLSRCDEARSEDSEVLKINGSVIRHGKYSDRIYLMKLAPDSVEEVLSKLTQLAKENEYGKLFAKVPGSQAERFKQDGFLVEATIPKFYQGREAVLFMSKFLKVERASEQNVQTVEKNLVLAKQKVGQGKADKDLAIQEATPAEAEEMAKAYKQVFASYPFPIFDPEYLIETMKSHIRYFFIKKDGKIIAIASAEMDREGQNVEMTDFATLPEYRGHGLAVSLLSKMEQKMKEEGLLASFTIARSLSAGINITFAKLCYSYAGTLVNNTNISGQIESMNVWYKEI